MPDSLIIDAQLVATPKRMNGLTDNLSTCDLSWRAAQSTSCVWRARRFGFNSPGRSARSKGGTSPPNEHPDSEVSTLLLRLIAVSPFRTKAQNDSGSSAPGAATPIAVMTAVRKLPRADI